MTYGKSLTNLADNLARGIHKIKCKYWYENNICETCGIKYRVLTVFNTEALKVI